MLDFTHNTRPLVRDYPGRLVPKETLTHSHPSWSSDILHQLPPSTTILSILFVTFTCLTVLFHNLSPGSLWSSSWPWNLSSYSIHFFTQSSSSFHHIIGKHYQAVWLKIKSICSFFKFLVKNNLCENRQCQFWADGIADCSRLAKLISKIMSTHDIWRLWLQKLMAG